MRNNRAFVFCILFLALTITSCGQSSQNNGMMQAQTPSSSVSGSSLVTGTPAIGMNPPAWYSVRLTDVNTGETFSIQDLKGKVVLVEDMAIWCTNCLQEQKNIVALHQKLGDLQDFVTVALDVDPNENEASLKAYTQKNGFDWKYAVASADIAREIAKLYGDQFLNPTSVPIVLIDREGLAQALPFGIKSTQDLEKAVNDLLKKSS